MLISLLSTFFIANVYAEPGMVEVSEDAERSPQGQEYEGQG